MAETTQNKKEVKMETKKEENKKPEVKKVNEKQTAPAVAADNESAKLENKVESKTEAKKDNPIPAVDNKDKPAVAKETKKLDKVERPKKEEAIAKGTDLHASKKHCMYICSFIKNKPISQAISELQEVIKMKRAIPFKGEIPHRHELGGRPGRYPVKVSGQFINLLKALQGNVLMNGLDIDKTRIYFASATWDSRPAKRGGMRFKRSFVLLKAKEFDNKKKLEAKK